MESIGLGTSSFTGGLFRGGPSCLPSCSGSGSGSTSFLGSNFTALVAFLDDGCLASLIISLGSAPNFLSVFIKFVNPEDVTVSYRCDPIVAPNIGKYCNIPLLLFNTA